jgi:hypothetical protein
MLFTLNALQLVLYIALLALVGQGLLALLAGAKRESNFFYKTLSVLTKPFTRASRWPTSMCPWRRSCCSWCCMPQ